MKLVEDLISELQKLERVVKEGAEKAFSDDAFFIADINRAQLINGFDSQGDQLGDYTPTTKKIRQKKGLQTKHIDLKFTGKFQRSIDVEKTGDLTYDLDASNSKWEDVLRPQERFKDAIGIQKKNEHEVTDIVILNINAEVSKLFKVNMPKLTPA